MDREWQLKPFEWCNFMIEWAQRILLESNTFVSGWNHLGPNLAQHKIWSWSIYSKYMFTEVLMNDFGIIVP